jgi:hypothetical protein
MTAYKMLEKILKEKNKLSHLEKAWDIVKQASFQARPEGVLCKHFSPQGVQALLVVVEVYEAELGASLKLDSAIADNIYKETTYFDDEALDEVDAYAIVYRDRIEFVAHVNGYGEKLPKKGRKYIGSQGDRRWSFPLNMLSEVRPFSSFVLDSDGQRL